MILISWEIIDIISVEIDFDVYSSFFFKLRIYNSLIGKDLLK